MKEEDRSLRQHWGEGDVEVDLSQCSKCDNNKGPEGDSCLIFKVKPDKYWDNEEVCPSRKEA